MRQTNVRFILSATLLFAIALVGIDFLNGTLYAQTQGQAGAAAQDSQQPVRPEESPSGVSGSQGSSQAPDDRASYASQGQASDNTQRAEGTPWRSIVLSFIAGTILGAVLFRRKHPKTIRDSATHDDRDDFRRAA
jgi:hypothetical protein